MDIDYDFEFLEDGVTIEMISIGMVREDGKTYYAVNGDIARLWRGRKLRRKIRRHAWLMENVVPHLPQPHGDRRLSMPDSWLFDYAHPLVKPKRQISAEVHRFIGGVDDPQLWADHGAYDHVVLCQLWGRMIDLPPCVPKYTNDLKQEAVRLGNPPLPQRTSTEHDALLDALYQQSVRRFLRDYEKEMQR
jgi:hypothetical protein